MRSSMVLSRDEAPTLPESQDEGVAVSPPREENTSDITRTHVPLPIVVALIGSVVSGIMSAAVGGWVFSAGIRDAQQQIQSDIRNINTRLENAEELKKIEKENLDLRLAAMKSDFEQSELRKALLDRLKPQP